MNVAIRLALAALALVGAPLWAAPTESAKPLFAADETIHITIRGPVDVLARGGPDSRNVVPGTIGVNGTQDVLPIQLALRGITRRQRDVCQFPPLRVVFNSPPRRDPCSPVSASSSWSPIAARRRVSRITSCSKPQLTNCTTS